MRVLGLDLSTNTGLAVMDFALPLSERVIHTRQITYPKLKGMERVNAIAADVVAVVAQYEPVCAAIEDYAVSSFGGSAITSIEIGTVIRFLFWQDEFPYLNVPPTSLKKFLTGKGNAKKENMILEVYKRYGISAPTNDIADAIALAEFGLVATTNGMHKGINKSQRSTVDAVLETQPRFPHAVFDHIF